MNKVLLQDQEEIALLTEDQGRKYCLLPVEHTDLWEYYQEHQNSFWVAREIDLSLDKAELQQRKPDGSYVISECERHLLKKILCFFAAADFIVADNMTNFMQLVKTPEAVMFYGFQVAMENVHSETYARLIETFSVDREEQMEITGAVFTDPAVKAKMDWVAQWMDEKIPFVKRLIAFAIVEGVFFSGSFCAIFWFKSKGKLLNGLCKSNEFIARDEGLHTRFATHLYNKHIPESCKLEEGEIHNMFKEAMEIEQAFMNKAIQVSLLGMNSDTMTQYIQYVTDYWLKQLNVATIYNVANPFDFMELLSLEGKTNFFEQRVSEYAKADLQRPAQLDFGELDF
jgi:ribonucleoside-diphosphate reductase beta chain